MHTCTQCTHTHIPTQTAKKPDTPSTCSTLYQQHHSPLPSPPSHTTTSIPYLICWEYFHSLLLQFQNGWPNSNQKISKYDITAGHCTAIVQVAYSPSGRRGGGALVHVKKRVAEEQFCKPCVRCVQLVLTTNSAPVTSYMTTTSTFAIWTSIANASFIAGTLKVIAIPNRCLATAKRPLKSNLMAQQRPRCACESGLATTGGSSKVNSKALHQKVRHIGSTSR